MRSLVQFITESSTGTANGIPYTTDEPKSKVRKDYMRILPCNKYAAPLAYAYVKIDDILKHVGNNTDKDSVMACILDIAMAVDSKADHARACIYEKGFRSNRRNWTMLCTADKKEDMSVWMPSRHPDFAEYIASATFDGYL